LNLPNKLTLLRILLIPVFLVLYLYSPFGTPTSNYLALIVFIAASATDALDGYIARTRGLITNFGKLMDPLADKMLVAAALIAMVQVGSLPAWPAILIICREFLISGFRMLALERSIVIAASPWGKIKTVSQIIMIIVIMLGSFPLFIEQSLIWIASALTVISASDYMNKNKSVLFIR